MMKINLTGIAILLLIIVVICGCAYYLGSNEAQSKSQALINSQNDQITNLSGHVVSLTLSLNSDNQTIAKQKQSITQQEQSIENLQTEYNITSTELNVSQIKLINDTLELRHPLLVVWNTNETINEGSFEGAWLFGSMFDAFDNHIVLNTSSPVWVRVFTEAQFALFYENQSPSAMAVYGPSSAINFWFNDSAGCAGYMYVIIPAYPGTTYVQANVSVLYNPAPVATGICAETS